MRRYIILAAALLAGQALGAQNLNPTVEVTNDFQGKLMEVEKHGVQMAVPDSLLKFDWNFNYSVFDNPYKGAYEFSPYRIEMKPDATVRDNRRFYLRAGAGYNLHPEAQLVLTPNIKGKFGFSLYDDFKGYFGPYHSISIDRTNNDGLVTPVGDPYKGSELSNRVGTTLRYDGAKAVLTLDGGMDLLKTKELTFDGNNMLGGSAALRVRSLGQSDLLYDVSLGWNGLSNRTAASQTREDAYTEHDAGLDARFVYRLGGSHSLRFEPSYHHVIFTEQFGKAVADVVDIAPAYVFSDGGFSIQAGVRFSGVWRGSEPGVNPAFSVPDYKGRKFYPDVKLYYEAVPDQLVLTAKVVGGQRFNTYGSYLKGNHHLSQYSTAQYSSVIGDATVNTFDAGLGLSGRVRSIFQYGFEAGFARYFNAPMDGIQGSYLDMHTDADADPISYVPVIRMTNYDLLYADVTGALATDRVDASAHLRVQKSNLKPEMEKGTFALVLPLFTGSAEFVYNWNRRVFAGLNAEWATGREGKDFYTSYNNYFDCHVPGWVDLGVTAEFRVNNRFSLWAEGRNLLNQTVMRNFMIAEKGPYVTAGVCLNL
jgi:hypothetical protein